MPGVSGSSGGGPFSAAITGGLMPGTPDGWGRTNSTKRKADSSHHRTQASNQRTIRTATLAGMEGKSAERLMKAHAIAEVKHNVVADGHDVKATAYETGNAALEAVRSRLESIDDAAHREINNVLKQKMNFALKWAKIVEIVAEARADAIRAVADGMETVLSTLSRVLTDTGQDKTVNDVVQGLDSKFKLDMPPSEPKMPDKAAFDESGSGAHSGAIDGQSASFTDNHFDDNNAQASFGGNSAGAQSGAAEGASNLPFSPNGAGGTAQGNGGTGSPPVGGGGVLPAGAGVGGAPAAGGGSAPRVSPGAGVPGGGGGGGSSVPSVPEGLTPAGLAQGFTNGMSTGAPAAMESNAATSSVVNAATGGHAGPPPAAAPMAGAGSVPVVSSAGVSAVHHVDSAPVEHVSASAAPAAAPPVVPPVAPPPVLGAPAPPPMPAGGPLPAYGADLRAAAAAAAPPPPPVTPPVTSAPPAAGSASTAPASGSTLNPAVVNKPAPAPTAAASSVGAPMVASAAAGAAAGAVAGMAAKADDAQRRCADAVAALAFQEPRLRWAAGLDDADGQVVVATDLAGGWLPSHVRPPAGVRLIEPSVDVASGRLSLDMLLGKTVFRADHVPGGPVSEPRVELSDWPRKLEPVPDVRWEIRQAADWRDGLPRLAHTMAKAWATGNGVRPMEIDALRDFISHTKAEVLRSYPGAVHPHTVGNWMLAAAIEAFNNGESLLGTYHFSWFRALCGAGQAV